MYVISADFKIQPDKIEAFGRLIDRQAKDFVELEKDCQQFDICQEETNPSVFLLYEIYSDKAAFEQHLKMPYTTQFFAEAEPLIAEWSSRKFNRRYPMDK